MSGGNGDGNGNGHGEVEGFSSFDWLGDSKKVKKPSKRIPSGKKRIRIGNAIRQKATKEGASESARLAKELENKIGKPIKIKANKWYTYENGKWDIVEDGKESFVRLALDIQDPTNRNVRRADDIVKYVQYKNTASANEQFVGALNHNAMNSYYLLNCSNCVLKIDSKLGTLIEILAHKPEYMFTSSLGSYVEGADCERFKAVLAEVLPVREDRTLLLDWFATCLLPDSRFECALFCIGGGSNGKSLVAETIADSIGAECRSAVTLQQICLNDRKHIHRLTQKLVNVSTETNFKLMTDSSLFKEIISGEKISTDRLYQEGKELVVNTKLCFLSNHTPMFKYGTEAEERRIRMIRFTRQFNAETKNMLLKRELVSERTGILAMLLRRLPRVCLLDELSYGSFTSRKSYNTFKINNDIVNSFLTTCTENVSNKFSIPKLILYEVFRDYCKANDLNRSLTMNQFYSQVKKIRPDINVNYKAGGRSDRHYSCRGLLLSDTGEAMFRVIKLNGGRSV